mmetsp:Transcript_111843/g.249618  ORF Transcript_111843/g.249618 Transcript_111843/m.249618 type:complete len:268 (-) Transcript_111843:80-883(-)
MADPISKIFPTEEDRVNCPFYFKIGACRNGDRCNRAHNRPTISSTLVIPHMYPNLPEGMSVANDEDWDDETYDRAQEHVEAFFEEVFLELASYGEIEDLVVLDNVSDHMLGNVYVKYFHEEAAERAVKLLTNRFYGARLLQAEFSPVNDFREARCRAFHETRCARGGLCNFMHIKHIPRAIKRRVVREMYDDHPEYLGQKRESKKEKDRDRGKDKEKKEKDRSRSRHRDKEKKDRGHDEAPPARQSSEERRAMIASWNAEREGGAVA